MPSAALLKWGALSIFVLQNAGVILMMKLSRNAPGVPYSTRVAVLVQELVKLLICSLLYAAEVGGPLSLVRSIRRDVRDNAVEWMQLGIPAALYTIQNNALFVGLSNLDAAVAHVTYQTKILFTALFSIVLMHKRLGPAQWCGIACLLMGVISVQGILDDLLRMLLVTDYSNAPAHTKSTNATLDTDPVAVRRRRDGHPRLHEETGGRLLAADGSSAAAVASTRMLGVGAVLTAAICTSFASVYFERMLKSERKPSLWLRNIQLAIYCGFIATITVLFEHDPMRISDGWLHGFTPVVWLVVALNVAGGLLVAVTIKYADNIIRGFAQAVAIIVGAVGSHFLFGFQFTPTFVLGVCFVVVAILVYGEAVKLDQICPAVCCSCSTKTAAEREEEMDLTAYSTDREDANGS